MNALVKPKSIAICFRGFELSVDEVESFMGKIASSKGSQGGPVKNGVKTILKRSFVRYSMDVNDECRLDEIMPRLFESLGGVKAISSVRDKVLPEFVDVDITIPVKGSEDQEGGFISRETLADLTLLCATLSFRFV
jgi:hypothetical protein